MQVHAGMKCIALALTAACGAELGRFAPRVRSGGHGAGTSLWKESTTSREITSGQPAWFPGLDNSGKYTCCIGQGQVGASGPGGV